MRDNYAAEEFAREKAAKELEKAVEDAVEKTLRETAAKMLTMGLSLKQVSQATGLSEEDVAKLKMN